MNDRIANAFRNPAALTDDDVAALVAAMGKDAAQANKRRRRLENAGGQCRHDTERDAARNLAYRQRRAELRKLKLAAE
ncbi:hypothetical protein [Roseovarius sp. 217]|uniref:hypothetical protein n=1 Tax=Roseovarius sp. (strain 217) TaxID=314264 RepID=UPI000068594B|nr:hypothetical protein [Roseovarius sp. 217]EAQ26704.1 hypothetical protein ROS217_19297 [Roseovarius sp. 217]